MLRALVLCHIFALSTGLSDSTINVRNDTLILHERVHNIIESITVRQSAKLWIVIGAPDMAEATLHYRAGGNGVAKMFYTPDYQLNRSLPLSLLLSDRRDYAAIFLSQTNDNRLENWLNASLQLPPDAIKIYVHRNDCRLNESQLSDALRNLWRSHAQIGSIYYMSLCARPPPRNNYVVNLFYYQPFRGHKSGAASGGDFGRVEKINLINASADDVEAMDMSSSGGSISQAFHCFPFAPHKLNFNGYLLTVILFPSTMAYLRGDLGVFRRTLPHAALLDPLHRVEAYFGEDLEALLELRRLLNFNINLSPTSDMGFYGFKLENGSFNGALGDLISRRADFMANACFVKDYLTDNQLEFSNAINDDKLCIVVRTAALVPTNKLILSLFARSVWILILITILSACLTHAILLTLIDGIELARGDSGTPRESQCAGFGRRLLRRMRDDTNIAFRIIAVVFGVSHLRGFSHSSCVRFFLAVCLVWSVVLTGAFTGLLYNVYTTPKSYPNIDTLEDLLGSKLEIHVRHPGLVTDIFGDGRDASTVAALKKRLRVSADDFLNQRIAARGDVAALERYANYDSENNKLVPREDGTSNLHLVEQCPRSYTLSYLLPKRSIYIKPINWYINIFMQSGLTAKWQADSKFYFGLEHALKTRHRIREIRVKINLQHLEMAFWILILGYVVSAAAFIAEIRWRRRE